VLSQIVDGVEQPIQFWSQVLKKYQKNWHIYYLVGEKFIVRTDHKFLVNLRNEKKDILQRWALEVEDMDYSIEKTW